MTHFRLQDWKWNAHFQCRLSWRCGYQCSFGQFPALNWHSIGQVQLVRSLRHALCTARIAKIDFSKSIIAIIDFQSQLLESERFRQSEQYFSIFRFLALCFSPCNTALRQPKPRSAIRNRILAIIGFHERFCNPSNPGNIFGNGAIGAIRAIQAVIPGNATGVLATSKNSKTRHPV